MAATFQTYGTGSVSAGTSVVITAPIGIQVSDLLVVYVPNGFTVTGTPSGWTHDTNSGCYWKIADASDAAASNFTFTISSATTTLVMVRINGVYLTIPIGPSSSNNGSSTTSLNVGAITPLLTNTLLLFFNDTGTGAPQVFAYATSNTSPSYTIQFDLNAGTPSNLRLGCATAPYAPATSTGSNTVTQGNSASMAGAILAINSAQPITVSLAIAGAKFGSAPSFASRITIAAAHIKATAGSIVATLGNGITNIAKGAADWLNLNK